MRKWRRDVEESFAAFLVPSIICTAIWIAVTGGGFFWPVFPMLFLGLNLVKTVVQRESVIEREVLRWKRRRPRTLLRNSPPNAVTRTRQGKGDRGGGAVGITATCLIVPPPARPGYDPVPVMNYATVI